MPSVTISTPVSIHAPVEGATVIANEPSLIPLSFNPRSRGGSDTNTAKAPDIHHWFQSTLPWRERHQQSETVTEFMAFQSTLPWRERPSKPIAKMRLNGFQSTLPWRERRLLILSGFLRQRFQSTLPWRERPGI